MGLTAREGAQPGPESWGGDTAARSRSGHEGRGADRRGRTQSGPDAGVRWPSGLGRGAERLAGGVLAGKEEPRAAPAGRGRFILDFREFKIAAQPRDCGEGSTERHRVSSRAPLTNSIWKGSVTSISRPWGFLMAAVRARIFRGHCRFQSCLSHTVLTKNQRVPGRGGEGGQSPGLAPTRRRLSRLTGLRVRTGLSRETQRTGTVP